MMVEYEMWNLLYSAFLIHVVYFDLFQSNKLDVINVFKAKLISNLRIGFTQIKYTWLYIYYTQTRNYY